MRYAATILIALLLIAACSSAPRSDAPAARRVVPAADVAVPPGIEPALLTPLTGDALDRARTSAADALARIPAPPELQGAETNAQPEPEPPLAAQHAYVAGRTALREGRREDAIAQLEQTLRLAPRSAAAMRLLGQVYAAANDPIRASQYYADAVRIDPAHAPSLFVLARFALQQGDWARCVALVRAAVERSDAAAPRDPVIDQLGQYYTAVALAKMGYLRAAIEQYQAFLVAEPPVDGSSVMLRELLILREQDRATWQTIGDLHHQLDEPAEARLAYDTAASGRVVLIDLPPRRVYTALRLDDHDAALQLVVQQLRDTHAGAAALDLARYAAGLGVDADVIAVKLIELKNSDAQVDGSAVTIALAGMHNADDAQRLLLTYLAQHPDEIAVFSRLLDYWLAKPADAIAGTADLMEQHPQQAEQYAITLLGAADDAPAFAAAFESLPKAQRQRAMVRVLEGLALANLARVDEAEAAFDEALALAPESQVARLQMAKVKVARGRFDEAAKLLESFGDVNDPSVVALRVRVLTETGDPADALALLDRMIAAGDADPVLTLQKARLQIALGKPEDGERTLLDALNLDPTNEAYYEALFVMYDSQDPAGRVLIRDSDVQYRRLMRRMLGVIPDSRIGKLKRAELHAASREYGSAIALLSSLVEQDHRDLIALDQLLGVLVEADRTPQAVELMEQRLKLFGRDPQVLELAARFYRQIGDIERMAAVQEQWLAMQPDSDAKLMQLAVLYRDTNRTQEAADLLAKAIDEKTVRDPSLPLMLLAQLRAQLGAPDAIDADFSKALDRYPDEAPDIYYRWAMTFMLRQDEAGYQRTLEEAHQKFPDHGPTNNDLGYLWIEQHQHLDEALKMIQSAVDGEPTNAAYLDSLGWANYKLGRYDDAVTWLRKAEAQANGDVSKGDSGAMTTQVVVMDHLGDALYRKGDRAEANRVWRQAQRVLSNLVIGTNEELVKVRETLANKTNAVRNNGPVPVADVPGQPAPPAGAPVEPAEHHEGEA